MRTVRLARSSGRVFARALAFPFTLAFVVAFALVLLAPATAKAEDAPCNQHLFVPLDVRLGGSFGRGSPQPFFFGAVPGLLYGVGSCGAFRFGIVPQVTYTNPDLAAGAGGRLAVRLLSLTEPLSEVGLYLELDGGYDSAKRVPLDAALVFNLAGLFRVGLWGQHEVQDSVTSVGLTIGTEFTSLFGGGDEEPDFGTGNDGDPLTPPSGTVERNPGPGPDFGDGSEGEPLEQPTQPAPGASPPGASPPGSNPGAAPAPGSSEPATPPAPPDEPDFGDG